MINLKAYDDENGYILHRDKESGELIWVLKAYARSDDEFLESAIFIPALATKNMYQKEVVMDIPVQNGNPYLYLWSFRTLMMFKNFEESDLLFVADPLD